MIPILRYRDAPAALEWLERAFGFERRLVVPGDDGAIVHARMTFGSGMIMLGSERGDYLTAPEHDNASVTQAICVVVPDADAQYARATAAGATIIDEIADQPFGGRLFTCRDLEGHVWTFGTHDPWD